MAYISANSLLIQNNHDFIEYSTWFYTIDEDNIFGINGYEFGYSYLAYIFKIYLGASYKFFSFIIVSVALLIKFFYISNTNKKNNLFLISVTYIILFYPYYESLALRSALALGLVFFAWNPKYISSKLVSAISIIIISSIQISSLIFLFPIVLRSKFYNKNFWLYILFLTIILSLFTNEIVIIISEYIPRLSSYYYGDDGYISSFSIPSLLILLVIYFIPVDVDYLINYIRNTSMYLLGISIITFKFNLVSYRFIDYGAIFTMLWVFIYDGKNKIIIHLIFLLYIIYQLLLKYTNISRILIENFK